MCRTKELYDFYILHVLPIIIFAVYLYILKFVVTIGTQAAVLAGLDITMFIEFNPPHNVEWVSR